MKFSGRHIHVAALTLLLILISTGEARAYRRVTRDLPMVDSTRNQDSLHSLTLTKSPTGAILRSLVFPGWGQFYNESYIKAGLFAAATVSVTGILIWNDSKYTNALNRYNALDSTDVLRTRTYREKEFYRDQRDVTGLWLLGIYTLAAVDAYVGAHLYDFDVSDKGVSVLPVARPDGLALQVTFWF